MDVTDPLKDVENINASFSFDRNRFERGEKKEEVEAEEEGVGVEQEGLMELQLEEQQH